VGIGRQVAWNPDDDEAFAESSMDNEASSPYLVGEKPSKAVFATGLEAFAGAGAELVENKMMQQDGAGAPSAETVVGFLVVL
jgi:hypothetical protein